MEYPRLPLSGARGSGGEIPGKILSALACFPVQRDQNLQMGVSSQRITLTASPAYDQIREFLLQSNAVFRVPVHSLWGERLDC